MVGSKLIPKLDQANYNRLILGKCSFIFTNPFYEYVLDANCHCVWSPDECILGGKSEGFRRILEEFSNSTYVLYVESPKILKIE